MNRDGSPTCRLLPLLALLLAVPALPALGQADADDDSDDDRPQLSEVVVVTASRTEQKLTEVPAAMSVITSEQMEQTAADDYGDYLRNVPGANVSQMSARDIQVTTRGATNSLATSQLVLLDNRSLYLDFFGFVMWDFAPLDPAELKQIEVVRGPGSAVWGANAMAGVINMITKSPREMQGTTVTLGGGEFGTVLANVTHAGVAGRVGYKVSAAYYEQDPYDRPTGFIPGTTTPYPEFRNGGTKQPKLNLRVDWEQSDDVTWSFAAGSATTDGIIHSGIGPFDIADDTGLTYFKVDRAQGAARVTFSANILDGDASNLLTSGPTGAPLDFEFASETYNLDLTNTELLGTRHVLTYGATFRRNHFDLSIAPAGDERQEYGLFIQDQFRIDDHWTWLFGARVDDLDPIGAVVSPRTSVMWRPSGRHTLRASWNRAFRAPSMVQNFLDVTILTRQLVDPAPSPALSPFAFQFNSDATGEVDLVEERMDAVELGWVGQLGDTTLTLSVYRNETTDSIDFFTKSAYPVDPNDPSIASQPILITDLRDASGAFVICPVGTELRACDPDGPGPSPTLYALTRALMPFEFDYRNIGELVDVGVEASANWVPSNRWSLLVNYSWQAETDVEGIPQSEVNVAPRHRANLGLAYSMPRWFANLNVNYADDAFWTDVLDSRFWGPTDSFTQVNLGFGVDLTDSVRLSVNAQNVFDEEIQQHVFGDLLARKVSGRLRFEF